MTTTTNTNTLRAAIEAAMRRRYANARGVSVIDGATSISTQRAGAVIDEPGIIREVCVLTHISADALGALAAIVGLRVETCGACNGRGRHAYGREAEDGCDECECAGIVVVDPAAEVEQLLASRDDAADAFDRLVARVWRAATGDTHEGPASVDALLAAVEGLRTDNARRDDVARGALDDIARVRAELAAVRAAVRELAAAEAAHDAALAGSDHDEWAFATRMAPINARVQAARAALDALTTSEVGDRG